MSDIDIPSLPPSEFTDLIDMLRQYEAELQNLLACGFEDKASCRRLKRVDIKNLVEKSSDIDAHYGWVLAADSAQVARMFQSSNQGEARAWVKQHFERYEKSKITVKMLAKKESTKSTSS
jgi:hypothetical protein